jgi:hypothetical protein
MNGAIPRAALIATGLGAGILALVNARHRKKYLIGGTIALAAGATWNAYVEAKVIQQVIAAGTAYAPTPTEIPGVENEPTR